jgi:hypothetical protein
MTVAGNSALRRGGKRAWVIRLTDPALPVLAATSKR